MVVADIMMEDGNSKKRDTIGRCSQDVTVGSRSTCELPVRVTSSGTEL